MIRPKSLVGIQARMGSSRLPGKSLKDICGKPLVRRVWEALGEKHHKVVLIPDTEQDDVLATLLRRHKMLYRRGSESNPLQRYYYAALEWNPSVLVRVCGDAPFLKPEWIDAAIVAACKGPIHVPGVLHAGSTADWTKCYNALNGVDEHAGHDWFAWHGGKLDLDVPGDYLMVNTPEDLEEARARFGAK